MTTDTTNDASWPPPLPSARRPEEKKPRRVPLWALVWSSVGALTLGSLVGTGTAGSDKADLQEQLDTVTQQLDTSQDALAQQEEDVAAAVSDLATATSSAAGLQSRIDALTAEASVSATTIASRESRIAELESAAAAAAATAQAVVAPAAAAAPSAPAAAVPVPAGASTYYENCTAVRAAGAAPIRTGDAGYSRKLDRDGDGIACE
ncbi:excalibur calcium-binding domain-containing protein [Rathayibacter sp. VKM Ac-2630]|uniref:excalibur calcium-binding domain-containing protein n=1 Tax=Rathayibacter sp. VKM Ac-2630 TaxID=1938617 RepID=UPI0009818869|nr:excalibur calcium-binding domain-containing protein [Rathayibacter sp. VKM Ac-2630]